MNFNVLISMENVKNLDNVIVDKDIVDFINIIVTNGDHITLGGIIQNKVIDQELTRNLIFIAIAENQLECLKLFDYNDSNYTMTLHNDEGVHTVDPITLASYLGHIDIIKWLLSKNVSISFDDCAPLRLACSEGHFEAVKLLVEYGSNINAYNGWPLGLACEKGYENIVKYLIQKGVDVFIDDNYAIKMACMEGHLNIIKILIDNGVDIFFNNEEPFKLACEENQINVIEYLITLGCNPNYEDNMALKKAIENKEYDIVKLLYQYNTNFELDVQTKIMIDIADFPKYENSFDKNELTCPISYLDITNYMDKIICGTCKNVFEKKSLISWLKINFSCPLCKENSFFYL